jgi:hypothetical protein
MGHFLLFLKADRSTGQEFDPGPDGCWNQGGAKNQDPP